MLDELVIPRRIVGIPWLNLNLDVDVGAGRFRIPGRVRTLHVVYAGGSSIPRQLSYTGRRVGNKCLALNIKCRQRF